MLGDWRRESPVAERPPSELHLAEFLEAQGREEQRCIAGRSAGIQLAEKLRLECARTLGER